MSPGQNGFSVESWSSPPTIWIPNEPFSFANSKQRQGSSVTKSMLKIGQTGFTLQNDLVRSRGHSWRFKDFIDGWFTSVIQTQKRRNLIGWCKSNTRMDPQLQFTFSVKHREVFRRSLTKKSLTVRRSMATTRSLIFWSKIYIKEYSWERYIHRKGIFIGKVYSWERYIYGKGIFRF